MRRQASRHHRRSRQHDPLWRTLVAHARQAAQHPASLGFNSSERKRTLFPFSVLSFGDHIAPHARRARRPRRGSRRGERPPRTAVDHGGPTRMLDWPSTYVLRLVCPQGAPGSGRIVAITRAPWGDIDTTRRRGQAVRSGSMTWGGGGARGGSVDRDRATGSCTFAVTATSGVLAWLAGWRSEFRRRVRPRGLVSGRRIDPVCTTWLTKHAAQEAAPPLGRRRLRRDDGDALDLAGGWSSRRWVVGWAEERRMPASLLLAEAPVPPHDQSALLSFLLCGPTKRPLSPPQPVVTDGRMQKRLCIAHIHTYEGPRKKNKRKSGPTGGSRSM